MSALYDVDDAKRRGAAAHYDVDPELRGPDAVIGAADVDVVLVLTSMNEHGPLARAALEAGKHVLVEKPMATSLGEAAELLELAETSPGLLVCAPHILLSPTFRAVHGAVRDGRIGELLTARARYGWAGPWWGEWFYAPGGGSLFDLGVYNVTSLCAAVRPGAARDGDDRSRDPRARGRTAAGSASRPRTTRTCCSTSATRASPW